MDLTIACKKYIDLFLFVDKVGCRKISIQFNNFLCFFAETKKSPPNICLFHVRENFFARHFVHTN